MYVTCALGNSVFIVVTTSCHNITVTLCISAHGFIATVQECSSLSDPLNGDVSVPSREYQGVATYSCNVGFTLNGNGERTCEDGGVWSGAAPTCRGEQELPVRCSVVLDLA